MAYGAGDLVVFLIVGVGEDLQQGTVRLHPPGRAFEGGPVLGLDLVSPGDELFQ
jgi:hypothetical protein